MVETASGPVEPASIEAILQGAVEARQALRRADASSAELEANRKAIVYWQARLSQALVDAGIERT